MQVATLEQDGWQLECVQALHAANPAAVPLPPQQALDMLHPGCLARLVFQIGFVDDDGQTFTHHQQLWVAVAGRQGRLFTGNLLQEPFLFAQDDPSLGFGARVLFHVTDVIDLLFPADLGPDEQALVAFATKAGALRRVS